MAGHKAPVLTIVAGPNGAGKSTLIETVQAAGFDTGPFVNPDVIANSIRQRQEDAQRQGMDIKNGQTVAYGDTKDSGTNYHTQTFEYGDTGKFVRSIEVQRNGPSPDRVEDNKVRYVDFDGPLYLTRDAAAKGTQDLVKRLNSGAEPLIPVRNNLEIAAGREALRVSSELRDAGQSFARESTLSSSEILRSIKQAKDAGYEVNLLYVGIQGGTETSKARVAERVKQGGHDIPQEAQDRRFDRSLNNASKAAKLADNTYFFDNSGEAGHQLVAEAKQGRIVKITDAEPKWLQQATKGLDREAAKSAPTPINKDEAKRQIEAAEKAAGKIEDPARKAIAQSHINGLRKAAGIPANDQTKSVPGKGRGGGDQEHEP